MTNFLPIGNDGEKDESLERSVAMVRAYMENSFNEVHNNHLRGHRPVKLILLLPKEGLCEHVTEKLLAFCERA
jgi:hypothetical protein